MWGPQTNTEFILQVGTWELRDRTVKFWTAARGITPFDGLGASQIASQKPAIEVH
jgi:hypothetical protein